MPMRHGNRSDAWHIESNRYVQEIAVDDMLEIIIIIIIVIITITVLVQFLFRFTSQKEQPIYFVVVEVELPLSHYFSSLNQM